jgi:predicted DCC family thiol-disulfide oxidoreductase YuxK
MNSELTEKTDIKEARIGEASSASPASESSALQDVGNGVIGPSGSGSPDRPGGLEATTPRADSFRGWILYDGDCRSCTASAKGFDRIFRRRNFVFLPLQTDWVIKRLGLESGAPLEEMRVLTADGRDIGGADAVIFLGHQIWWAWPFVALARLPGVHTLLDRGYRWIAAHRGCDHIGCSLKKRRSLDRHFCKSAAEKPPLLEFWPAWIPLIGFPSLALLARNHVAPWQFMWLMAGAIFFGCKWLTFSRAQKQIIDVRLGRALSYFFLWPGMDAEKFLRTSASKNMTALSSHVLSGLTGEARESREQEPVSHKSEELSGNTLLDKRGSIGVAIAKFCFGSVILFGLARFARQPLLTGWLGMIGMILILHFGVFALLATAWRAYEIDARPIMDSPLKSITLGEFWGRRWNGAFNQLAFEILFRPLARITTPIIGTLAAFFASGLIHELVISLPARAGYGLPTAYFLLQGCGVLVQHRVTSVRRGTAGRFFTILVAAGPAFWLFHPPFVRNVILPFMKAIGAL